MSEGWWGTYGGNDTFYAFNNTYKGIRVVSEEYNLYYAVWCTNEHELYDLHTDPGQVRNLLRPGTRAETFLGQPIDKVLARLDALLFVTKSCKGATCVQPWRALHPKGNVDTLRDALSPRFDAFYGEQQRRVEFSRCEMANVIEAEGPQFQNDGFVYWEGTSWSDWT